MSKNRLKLDWALSTSTERNNFLSTYLAQEPFLSSPPNEDELETLANYVLWGKNEEGQNKTLENGLPAISKEYEKDFYEEINELLMIENEIEPYYIDKKVFEYEDINGKYDVLSAKELFLLMSVLCKPEETEGKEAE